MGAIVALLDTPFVGYISRPRRARDHSILSFIHSPETLFIFLLSLIPPRNKKRSRDGGGQREDRGTAVAVAVTAPLVPAFALSTVISLKSNCTRKNGSPLSGKQIARHRGGRLSRHFRVYARVSARACLFFFLWPIRCFLSSRQQSANWRFERNMRRNIYTSQ